MKRFLCMTLLLSGAFLAAAETLLPPSAVLAGNFAQALDIQSASLRQAALLKLLAVSSGDEELNDAIYVQLSREFEEKAPDRTVQDQLLSQLKARPGDLMTALLFSYHGNAENNLELLEKSLDAIDPAAWQGKRFARYVDLVDNALNAISDEGDPLENAWMEKIFERRLALIDRVIAKQKCEVPELIAFRLDLLRKALYYCNDLEPAQRQFQALPSSHRRKKLYMETLARWKKTLFAQDKTLFFAQFELAIKLRLPECGQFANKAVHRYGVMDAQTAEHLPAAAIALQKYAVFAPCAAGKPAVALLIALTCKDFDAAEKIAFNAATRRVISLSRAAEKKDNAEIFRILGTLPPKTPLTAWEYQFLLQLAESTRDVKLYRQLRRMIFNQCKAEDLDVSIANSIGYVAVELNVDLEIAAKLLERVWNEENNSAYADSLAMLRLRQGRHEEAAQLIREAFSLREPGEAASVFLLHAAQIMAAKGDKALARKLLERAKRCVRPEDFEYDHSVEKTLTGELK